MRTWCEHCNLTDKNQLTITESFKSDGFRWSLSDGSSFKFCPICSAPRPKERSLEEKFHDYMNTFSTHILVKHYHDKEGRTTDEQVFHKARFEFVSSELANIAKEHYEGNVRT